MSDYDTDILIWSERQGELLRRRAAGELVNEAELDRPNIAEAVEDVGPSQVNPLPCLTRTVPCRSYLTGRCWSSIRECTLRLSGALRQTKNTDGL
jgi:hypothetical protein